MSGGLDSRAFTCAVPRDFRPIWARTRGSDSSPDVVCAKEISRRLGIEHFQEDPQDVPYSAFAAKAVWRTECEVTFTHCFSIAAHEPMKRHGDFLFAGQSGEIVAGGHIYPYMLVPRSRRSFVERAYDWYLIYPERKLQRIFNPDFLRRTFPDLKAAFLASFDAYDGDSNADAYQIWDLQERQARMTLSAGPVDSHLFEKVYALIGRTYTDYALGLPLRLRYGQTLYQCMILELGPELLDVPYANTGLCLRGSIPGNLWNKVHHLARKGTERLAKRLGLSEAPKAVGAAEEARRALRDDPAFRRIITGFVESEHFDPGIFNRQGIQSLLEEEYSGKASHVSLLCLFATFAVGLPYFVYKRPLACPADAEPVPEPLQVSTP